MAVSHADAVVKINALLCREFKLVPSTQSIVYHHWYDLNSGLRTDGSGTTKTCPGTGFFGGNTTEAAGTKFVPLVTQALAVIGAGTTPSPALPAFRAEVIAGVLNVRGGQGTSFPILKSLKRGVRVNVYETSGEWCRIHPGQQQWVAARYLHIPAEAEDRIPAAAEAHR